MHHHNHSTQHIPQFQGHKHTTISCKQRVDIVDNKQRDRRSEENVLKMICTERYDLTFFVCVYALRHRHQYKKMKNVIRAVSRMKNNCIATAQLWWERVSQTRHWTNKTQQNKILHHLRWRLI